MGNLTICLGQLRSNTCGYLRRVAAGETIDVVRRGALVARIISTASEPKEAPPTTHPIAMTTRASRRIGIDELRVRAGRQFDRVAAGEMVEVIWQGRLVAQIVPIVSR
jgi:antitoxin (DNA-binding transcriptional repressor) of toxin-antitoxin stability system